MKMTSNHRQGRRQAGEQRYCRRLEHDAFEELGRGAAVGFVRGKEPGQAKAQFFVRSPFAGVFKVNLAPHCWNDLSIIGHFVKLRSVVTTTQGSVQSVTLELIRLSDVPQSTRIH